ncbi:MAG: DUF5320 domain-containing protein [Candidatus Omnitrophica bacterium]|nr:DUF5320 domain-containing protein [Candidatus Omnitrophota bacterium]
MPGFDGTGPYSQGAMTGGGRGNCVVKVGDSGLPAGFRGFGRGFGGRGLGHGRGNCFRALRASGQNEFSQLTELQAKFDRLQADFEALKAKGQQV